MEPKQTVIKVSSFAELIVIVAKEGKLIVAHGNAAQPLPGLIVTRETWRNTVMIDFETIKAGFDWQRNIVHEKTGETLLQYRDEQLAWFVQAFVDPENKPGYAEVPASETSPSTISPVPVASPVEVSPNS